MKKKLPVLLFSIVAVMLLQPAAAQIVNMESQRYHKDSIGWSGSISGALSLTSYGEKVFAVDAAVHLQYQSSKSLYLLLGNYGFLKGDGLSYIDYGFLHFRYNYKLTKVLRAEAFTQLQQNAITKVQSRFLAGAGPRFKIAGTKKVHLYAGTLVMYEIEKQTDVEKEIHGWRGSDYVSITWQMNEQTEFNSTTYYQPLFARPSDFRLANQTSFKIKAGKRTGVSINWNYQHDSSPATGVTKDTYSFSTGIDLNL